jgi:transcriptional regulator with XRE-family HTH domain
MTPLAASLAERGMSQGELMRRTGLAKETVSRAYHGRPVSPTTMIRIAKALDVPLSVLDPVTAEQLAGLIISGG